MATIKPMPGPNPFTGSLPPDLPSPPLPPIMPAIFSLNLRSNSSRSGGPPLFLLPHCGSFDPIIHPHLIGLSNCFMCLARNLGFSQGEPQHIQTRAAFGTQKNTGDFTIVVTLHTGRNILQIDLIEHQ